MTRVPMQMSFVLLEKLVRTANVYLKVWSGSGHCLIDVRHCFVIIHWFLQVVTVMTPRPVLTSFVPEIKSVNSVNACPEVINIRQQKWSELKVISWQCYKLLLLSGLWYLCVFSGCDCDDNAEDPDELCPLNQKCKQCKCIPEGENKRLLMNVWLLINCFRMRLRWELR